MFVKFPGGMLSGQCWFLDIDGEGLWSVIRVCLWRKLMEMMYKVRGIGVVKSEINETVSTIVMLI